MSEANENLMRFNAIYKRQDETYRSAAKQLGYPDCAFWILYTLRAANQPMTQSDLCDMQYMPKQTINSSLKKLEAEGYLRLVHHENRRSKRIELTPAGESLAKRTADKVILAENEALLSLKPEALEQFLGLYEQFVTALQENIHRQLFPDDKQQ